MAALESGEIEEVILAGFVADFGAAMTQRRQIERPTDSTSSPNTEA